MLTYTSTELLPQAFLLNGGSLAQLAERYAIKHQRHAKYQNLVQLKYDQINSPMGEPLVQQCRGLILDEANDWHIVARPFDKFFNYGEGHAKPIDWSTARVQEKLDGSLMILYHYDGQWHVASSGMPDARGEVNGCSFTFSDLFWRVWREKGYDLPRDPHVHTTFMFELMTPYNRVVVRHAANDLKLIGVRENADGIEYPAATQTAYNWRAVNEFGLSSLDDVMSTFAIMDPLAQEGYVVVDGLFNRVKVKHPGYVAIHHMRDGFGVRRVLEVIRSGETTELLTHFPEWQPAFDKVQSRYDELVKHLELEYDRLKDIPEQKAFALEAVKTRNSAALFQLRKGTVKSVRESLANMTIDKLMEQLRVKDIEL